MREIKGVRQIPGEPRRRWFSSPSMDLFVWVDAAGAPIGFELAYDKEGRERALGWKPVKGYSHAIVDDGESGRPLCKATPILISGGKPDVDRILGQLRRQGQHLPADILGLVLARIRAYPA